ncbi:hypothetical protein ACGFYY_04595 [Streptomyces sp. NPDC048331]|uniref:hypothetical protein n=1 Tax=Streptomyces sp. NPDC048331 TaxID=3365534 RepID=UPI003716BCEF
MASSPVDQETENPFDSIRVGDVREIVREGDKITVRIVAVDLTRQRLSLSCRGLQNSGRPRQDEHR